MERVYILEAYAELPNNKYHYKFGRTVDIDKHIKCLQLGNPQKLVYLTTYAPKSCSKLKAYICKYLDVHHIQGDWFELSEDELVDAQREIQKYIDRENIVN